METKKINDVVDLLVDNAYQILNDRLLYHQNKFDELSVPKSEYIIQNNEELLKIVDLIKPMLKSAQQTRQIRAESAKDVTRALRMGKITINEAKELLKVVEATNNAEISF